MFCRRLYTMMENKLLENYLQNACTPEELKAITDWLNDPSSGEEGKAMLYKFWQGLSNETDPGQVDLDVLLNRIHHQINISESNRLITDSGNDLIGFNRRRNIFRIMRNIAAVLLLPVVGLALYLTLNRPANDTTAANPVYYEVTSSVDAITRVTLSDGTDIWLNRGSSLRYPEHFKGDTRDVELKGEGYVSVAHNEKIPFVVHAGDLQIVATGTEFNVMAYPDEKAIETTLVNGRVELRKAGKDGRFQSLVQMQPSEMASFDPKGNRMVVRKTTDDRYYSWKDGKLIFVNEPMDAVIRKLGRWYNVDVDIRSKSLYDLSYTATFENETFPQVLELMAMATPIRYSISERESVGQGMFSRRKVTIWHK